MLTEDVMGDEHPNNGRGGLAIILLTPLIFLLGKWGFTANWPVKAAPILPRPGLSEAAATAAALPGALKTRVAFPGPASGSTPGRVVDGEGVGVVVWAATGQGMEAL